MNEVLFDLDLLSVVTPSPAQASRSSTCNFTSCKRSRTTTKAITTYGQCQCSLSRAKPAKKWRRSTSMRSHAKGVTGSDNAGAGAKKKDHMPETYGSVYDRERHTAFESNEHLLRQIPVRVRFEVS